MKKFLAIFLALTIVLGLCACGGPGSNGDHGLTEDGRVKLSIGLPTNAMVLSHDNNAYTKWIEETCGVELTFVEYAGGTDVATQISTTIAANQELPDILWGIDLGEKTYTRYGEDGYFVDLKDYYADKEGKSKMFWERFEKDLTQEEQEEVLRTMEHPVTGAIYGAPCVETSLIDGQRFQPWINVKWLEKLGLEKPTNNEELVKVLKAFKDGDPNGNGDADEIPLMGTQTGALGAYVVDWLINLFVYYDATRPYLIDENGKLTYVYTTDEYREALKFIRELYDEKLLSPLTWTASGKEMKQITTPSTGVPLCGIFTGHLTPTVTRESEVLYEYEPLATWGSAINRGVSCNISTFITESCTDVDKAFEVIMNTWSWEGSQRARYGEYGVNWGDATPGAITHMGLEATYKLINDPLSQQTTAKWSKMGPVLNIMAEGELGELSDEMTPWFQHKSNMHAESDRLLKEAAAKNNPEKVCPKLVYTEEEEKALEAESTNVGDRWKKAQTEFLTGVLDINSDADWNEYLQQLNDMGLQKLVERAQKAYDRG